MAKGPDPRVHARPLGDVPALVAAGARAYNARQFWDAHESWEEAWHALRAGDKAATAAYLRGMILITAALENATREKSAGFKRQFAEGLDALLEHADAAPALGVRDARAWHDALVRLYVSACRRRDWSFWNTSGWTAPTLEVDAA